MHKNFIFGRAVSNTSIFLVLLLVLFGMAQTPAFSKNEVPFSFAKFHLSDDPLLLKNWLKRKITTVELFEGIYETEDLIVRLDKVVWSKSNGKIYAFFLFLVGPPETEAGFLIVPGVPSKGGAEVKLLPNSLYSVNGSSVQDIGYGPNGLIKVSYRPHSITDEECAEFLYQALFKNADGKLQFVKNIGKVKYDCGY